MQVVIRAFVLRRHLVQNSLAGDMPELNSEAIWRPSPTCGVGFS